MRPYDGIISLNMGDKLNIQQRITASLLYLAVISGILYFFSDSLAFFSGQSEYGFMFVSAALLLIFGTYITEPYFTKPVDTITNSTAILIALFGIQDKDKFIAYESLVFITFIFLLFGLVSVLFSNQQDKKWQIIIYQTVTKLGRSKVAYSVLYIATLASFFTQNTAEFWALLTFWILLLSQSVIEPLVLFMWNLFSSRSNNIELGKAIGRENPFLFKIRVDRKQNIEETSVGKLVYINADNNKGLIGVIANEKTLLNERWLTVYLLQKDRGVQCIDLTSGRLTTAESPFSSSNKVYSLTMDKINEKQREFIKEELLFKNSSKIVGYVAQGSNINRVRFETLPDLNRKDILIQEGMILQINVNGEKCLYQVVDANTDEKKLEVHNSTGFTVGIAQKLGRYVPSKREIEIVKWLPEIYSPVYAASAVRNNIDNNVIGTLPGTNMHLGIKDYNSLVTHNTAILGILGIGKSSLTFELLQKTILNTQVKVVCLDITNEYAKELINYINHDQIKNDLSDETKAKLKSSSDKRGNESKPSDWGNENEYKSTIDVVINDFMESSQRVLILNPDLHAVSKPSSQFKINENTELSVAQKTRIISERVFMHAKKIWDATETQIPSAKLLIVYEEAHSLIPEWNSSANDGDQHASNGTAKVIMQGRKYGLGSLVVTQRTASISKSILNQCNTIFAMRVFDDTGKQFLENYVGSDYANALPTLAERHAVVVGKALSLKQPIIIQLNDKKNIIINDESNE